MKEIQTPTPASQIRFRDEDVSQRIASYLSHQGVECLKDLEIEVHDGVVTLSGLVADNQQRQMAVNSCQRVAGVLQLIDQLEVIAAS